jgi:hypothetical protein
MFTVGRLVGNCSPATDNDGHATKRPSTFFEHHRRLIQPTRKPSDLTDPSTESDQVQSRIVGEGIREATDADTGGDFIRAEA